MKKTLLGLFLLLSGVAFSQVSDATMNTDVTYIKTHVYNPTEMGNRLQNIIDSKISTLGLSTSGTNTYTASFNSHITSYQVGQTYPVRFGNGNTGASTLNLNGLGAKPIVTGHTGAALSSGDIAAGEAKLLMYDGTSFQLMGGTGGGGGSVTSVTGTSLRISSTGGTTPVIDIAAGYVGQTSITTLGTLTTGATGAGFTLNFGTSTLSGRVPFANLTQGSALSVLGVTGNSTADNASIAAASDGQVLRRSGTAVAFGAVNLASANAITGNLPVANLNSGTSASSSTFWRGDNVWATPTVTTNPGLNLALTGVKTGSYTAAVADLVVTDASSATVPITLPTAPPNLSTIAVKMIAIGNSFTTTVTTGGSDVFNKAGGSTTLTMRSKDEAILLQYNSSTAIWVVVATDNNVQFNARTVTTTDAFVQTDNKGIIWFNSGSNFNVTVNQLTVNTRLDFINIGAGTVTFVNGSGVTFSGSSTLGPGQNGTIIYRTATAPLIFTGLNFTPPTSIASGDIAIGTAAGILGTLPISSNGKFLTAASSFPAWSNSTIPSSAGTARKILVSNGTDYVLSTELYAVPGTSGNLFTSNGTDWTSAAPTFWNLGGTSTLSSANTIVGTTTNKITLKFDNLGVTTTDGAGVFVNNTTASTNGAPQMPGTVTLGGSAFASTPATSKVILANISLLPIQGTTTIDGNFRIGFNIDGAGYVYPFQLDGGSGVLTISGSSSVTIDPASGTITGNVFQGSANVATSLKSKFTTNGSSLTIGNTSTVVSTTSTANDVRLVGTFSPPSGSTVWNTVLSDYTISQAGGANGAVTGINLAPTYTTLLGPAVGFLYNPTRTSVSNTEYSFKALAGSVLFTQANISANFIPAMTVTPGTLTSMTASTELPDFVNTAATHTWAAGALALQRYNQWLAPTMAFASSSTATEVFNGWFDAPVAGTNATITNAYAAGFGGNIALGNAALTGSNRSIVATGSTSNVDMSFVNKGVANFNFNTTSGNAQLTPAGSATSFVINGVGSSPSAVMTNDLQLGKHLVAATTSPSIAAGTGAGTSPTISISGTDVSGFITITTGTLPTGTNATIATVTFGSSYSATPKYVGLNEANNNSVALIIGARAFIDQASTSSTQFILVSGATALTASTTYKWYYHVIQ